MTLNEETATALLLIIALVAAFIAGRAVGGLRFGTMPRLRNLCRPLLIIRVQKEGLLRGRYSVDCELQELGKPIYTRTIQQDSRQNALRCASQLIGEAQRETA